MTLVHKGNIQKFTEGAFRKWGYELAAEEYAERLVPGTRQRECASRKIVIKDVIADIFFQQALLRPEEFDVIATMNLNGDYMSDALAAQVGESAWLLAATSTMKGLCAVRGNPWHGPKIRGPRQGQSLFRYSQRRHDAGIHGMA